MVSPRPGNVSPCDTPPKGTIHWNRAKPNTALLGAYTLEGKKAHMPQWTNQDAHLVKELGNGIVLLAVIDGHGEHGHVVAKYVRDFISENGKGLLGASSSTLQQLFRNLQGLLETGHMAQKSQFSGATSTVAILDTLNETMTVAHVGDSRLCVMDEKGKPCFETVDHTVSGEDENHIVATGGDVHVETVCGITARRVYRRGERFPGLAMSRSLGDCVAHTLGVRAEPTVVTVPLIAGQTVVVASDGVWEHMTAEEVAAVVGREDALAAGVAAQDLVHAARQRWVGAPNIDDITSVVFRNSKAVTPSCASDQACGAASPSRRRALTC
jgi:serine/threonine protein phosphatase PrpC